MRTLSLLTLVLASAVVNLGCGGDDITTPPDDTPAFTVLPKVTALDQGRSLRLAAWLKNSNGSLDTPTGVTWESANAAIASVDGTGVVHSLQPGRVQILAKWHDERSSSLVTVLKAAAKKPRPECLDKGTVSESKIPTRCP